MDPRTHMAATDQTAIYPQAGTGQPLVLAYTALGLAGEAAEVLLDTRTNPAGVLAELGDVHWYFSRLHRELGLDPHATAEMAAPVGEELPAVEELVAAAGKVAEMVKKTIRDDAGQVTAARLEILTAELGRVWAAMAAIAAAHGSDLGQVAEANIAKLTDRARRGVLQGSGSNR
jgi:NTP pyrophosphatase (non-canonical NTP hydrolase)